MNWGTQFGLPAPYFGGHAPQHFGMPSNPQFVQGGFGVRQHDYAPVSAFERWRAFQQVPYPMPAYGGYGLTDENLEPEAGGTPTRGLTGEQIMGIASAGEALFGAASEAYTRHRESMKSLINQRISLKKKIAGTSDPWKRKRYNEELAYVNMQIASLETMLSEEEDVGGGEFPWPLIIGVLAIGGLVVFGLTRVSARRKREPAAERP